MGRFKDWRGVIGKPMLGLLTLSKKRLEALKNLYFLERATALTRVRALRAKTRIFSNIWPLAQPNIAENLLASRLALASSGKTLDFRNPKS